MHQQNWNNGHHMHGHMHHRPHHMPQQISAPNLMRHIKPNIIKRYNTAKFWFIMGAVLWIAFIGVPILLLAMNKFTYYQKLAKIVRDIQLTDKMSLADIHIARSVRPDVLVQVVRRLIETGNLPGYQMIGNVGVAKIGMSVSEADFAQPFNPQMQPMAMQQPHPQQMQQQPQAPVFNQPQVQDSRRCGGCGSAITAQNNGRFCKFCKARLN